MLRLNPLLGEGFLPLSPPQALGETVLHAARFAESWVFCQSLSCHSAAKPGSGPAASVGKPIAGAQCSPRHAELSLNVLMEEKWKACGKQSKQERKPEKGLDSVYPWASSNSAS